VGTKRNDDDERLEGRTDGAGDVVVTAAANRQEEVRGVADMVAAAVLATGNPRRGSICRGSRSAFRKDVLFAYGAHVTKL
jgi:hypothetical protein